MKSFRSIIAIILLASSSMYAMNRVTQDDLLQWEQEAKDKAEWEAKNPGYEWPGYCSVFAPRKKESANQIINNNNAATAGQHSQQRTNTRNNARKNANNNGRNLSKPSNAGISKNTQHGNASSNQVVSIAAIEEELLAAQAAHTRALADKHAQGCSPVFTAIDETEKTARERVDTITAKLKTRLGLDLNAAIAEFESAQKAKSSQDCRGCSPSAAENAASNRVNALMAKLANLNVKQ